MPAGGVLATVFTGTILATGKTFTHGLGTTPDFVYVTPETDAATTNSPAYFVSTFDTQVCVVGGPLDDCEVRIHVQRLHSIVG